jgi:CBS domain containing-hemolysin-like protein
MQPATFIPSTIELDILIERMRDDGIEAVITIDEFGGVDGLVTLEDLIEELVGEVKDEHDESGAAIKQLSKQRWSVSGLLRQDEINQVVGVMLPEDEEFETLGGLVLDQLEELPEVGDAVTILAVDRSGNRVTVKLTVIKMDGRRIDRIELEIQRSGES